MAIPLRVLILEDNPSDADLILSALKHDGFDTTWVMVDNEPDFLEQIAQDFDVILSDFNMPQFDALRALEVLKENKSDIPLIIVSGSIGEDTAVRAMQAGAADYLLKDRLTRLGQAVASALLTKNLKLEQQMSEERYRTLVEQVPAVTYAFEVGDNSRLTYISPQVAALLGYTPEECLSAPDLWLEYTLPEDRPKVMGAIDNAMRYGQPINIEYRIRRRDGSALWFQNHGTIVRGHKPYLHGILIDITERVAREREREAIIAISMALRVARNSGDIQRLVLDRLMSMLEATGAAIVTRKWGGGGWKVADALGDWRRLAGRPLPAEIITAEAIESGRPFISDNVRAESKFILQDLIEGGTVAAMCLPMLASDEGMGSIWVARPGPFAEEEVRLAAAVGDIAANALRRADMHEQTQLRLNRMSAVHAIDVAITSSLDLRVTLNVLLDHLLEQLKVDAGVILLLSAHSQVLEHFASRGFNSDAIRKSRVTVGQGAAGEALLHNRRVLVADLASDAGQFGRSRALTGEQFGSSVAVPLVAKGQPLGVLEVYSRSPDFSPDLEWLDFLDTLAGQAAMAIDNATMFNHMQRANADLVLAYDTTLEGWSRALDMRDKETEWHTRRVTETTIRLAQAMGVADDQLIHIRRGALLHDIGKMGIPDGILLKPGPLNDEEWAVMRRHPDNAYQLLSPIPFLRPALDIPYCHHERWDGTGYPRQLQGEEIPLAARIFAVADVWDALSSDRPYRRAWPMERVVAYIRDQAGLHFDPNVVEVFLSMIKTADPHQ